MIIPSDALTMEQVRAATGMTMWQVRYLITTENIRCFKRGRKWWFHPQDVAKLVAQTWQGNPYKGKGEK